MIALPSSEEWRDLHARGPRSGPGGDSPEHELILAGLGVDERVIRSVQRDRVDLGLVVEPPLILVCIRFGEAIPWTWAPYHWRRPDGEAPDEPRIRTKLGITMVDPEGRIRVRRTRPLARGVAMAWTAAIEHLADLGCSRARYAAALAQFGRLQTCPLALLSRAIVLSVDDR